MLTVQDAVDDLQRQINDAKNDLDHANIFNKVAAVSR